MVSIILPMFGHELSHQNEARGGGRCCSDLRFCIGPPQSRQAAMTLAVAFELTHEQLRRLDRPAPTHITVPSGSRLPLDYEQPDSPVLAVRLQETFGCKETPRVANGTIPVILHLLSPAKRPVQVTQDLGGFWKRAYQDVRKELRGRYPKHHWPDDPIGAAPTAQAKQRNR